MQHPQFLSPGKSRRLPNDVRVRPTGTWSKTNPRLRVCWSRNCPVPWWCTTPRPQSADPGKTWSSLDTPSPIPDPWNPPTMPDSHSTPTIPTDHYTPSMPLPPLVTCGLDRRLKRVPVRTEARAIMSMPRWTSSEGWENRRPWGWGLCQRIQKKPTMCQLWKTPTPCHLWVRGMTATSGSPGIKLSPRGQGPDLPPRDWDTAAPSPVRT